MSRFEAVVVLSVLALLVFDRSAARAQDGDNFWIAFPLHAVVGLAQPCELGGEITCYCASGGYGFPTRVVPANTEVTIFLSVWDLCDTVDLMGVQTAFQWDKSWTLLGSAWDCQENQLTATVPQEPGGSTAGTITTAFDCVHGQYTVNIGRMFFRTGASGCLFQVQSSYPFGIHGLDCNAAINGIYFTHPLDPYRLGSICVGDGSPSDGCFDPGPVEEATWGRIKATYRD